MRKNLLKLALFTAFAAQAGMASAASVAVVGSCTSAAYLNNFGHKAASVSEHASLDGYDAVLVASNCGFADPVAFGDKLKNFVDAGHNVVITEFSLQGPWQVSGGINSKGYNPFINDPSAGGYIGSFLLGTNYAPASTLFAGVNLANVGTSYAGLQALSEGATLIADWEGGRHAIAYNIVGGAAVVGLNLYPGDGYVNEDTQRLVSNALGFEAAPGNDVPEPASLALLALGAAGAFAARRRRSA